MRGHLVRAVLPALALSLLAFAAETAAGPAYCRYPDISGGRIVFSAEADLWVVSDQGGPARRLTTHPGTEYFPQFSPDGSLIAFTGEYDGNRDVFVITAEGGEPRRLTWHPGPDEVLGWTPDGKKILFRSRRLNPLGFEVFTVAPGGGDPERVPVGYAGRFAIDPQSGLWAFNRVSQENATWKRYRGGLNSEMWVGDPRKADFKRVSGFDGMNGFPMWHQGRIYYLCDRGGTANIWSMKPDGSDAKRHTDLGRWDARWPSIGPDGRIVFTLAADIHVFDPASGAERGLDVDLGSDRALTRERYPDAERSVSWFDLAPEGDRLAVVARGEIFSVPVKEGVTLPITRGSGARENWASFDPKGERLVYVTDAPHEEEIRTVDAWGRGEPKVVLPAGETGWHYPPVISPDGKWIAYSDQTYALFVVPAEGGTPRTVDRSVQWEITDYAWSPDGRWLAYSKQLPNQYSAVHIYDTKDGSVRQVTGPATDDISPSWDPDGRYLYFISRRSTNPIIGFPDYTNVEAKNSRPYMILLRKDVKNPLAKLEGLPPEDGDKDKKEKEKKGGKEKDADEDKDEIAPVEIDFDGLSERVVEFPVPRGRYFGVNATSKNVFYVSAPVKGMAEEGPEWYDGGEPTPDNDLISFDLEKKEAKAFVPGMTAYALAAKGGKIAVLKGPGEIFVVEAGSSAPDMDDAKVSLDGLVIELDPMEEWVQIFHEAWRFERDFYWDAGMGSIDWEAERDRYAALLPRLSSRDDLRDLVGELIGELNNSHTYIWGGDPGVSFPRVPVGLLGADVAREGDAYRVTRIYRGDAADVIVAPLAAPGVGVSEGEYILAVNHERFEAGRSFHSYFDALAGKPVVLTVNSRPAMEGARDVVVTPTGSEGVLRYTDWVRRNREYVAEKTGGKIGYIHIPDMGTDGLIEFNTWFYPQLDKEGMIVDARWNGGGSVSQMIMERLRRSVTAFGRARGGSVYTYPDRVLNGPFVVLTNEFAGSDGDIFPAAIQLEKLAPVIGKRSWGGVVGIRGDKALVDGGMVTQPEFSWWDSKGGWSIENHGVDPDIVVENLPQDVAAGKDPQLDRAISEVLKLHAQEPPSRPVFGSVRNRTREAFGKELLEQR
jgi:tricorn protease